MNKSHFDILYMLTWRDISVRYKQSLMGFLWAILMPAMIAAAGIMVRFAMAKVSGTQLRSEAVLAVTIKALPWAFFVSSLRIATASLTANASLVTKIAFPRIVFPLSAILSQLFDFAIAAIVVTIIFLFLGVGFTANVLWIFPLFVILVSLTSAFCILLSAANLFYRDVKYLVEVVVMFAVFVTPVFYEVEMFADWANLLLINPIAPILEGLYASVIKGTSPSLQWTFYSAAFAIFGLLASVTLFRALEPKFAESI